MGLTAVEADAVAHDVHARCVERVALLRRLTTFPPPPPAPRRRWFRRTAAPPVEGALEAAHREALDLRLRAERAAAEAAVVGEERAAVAACDHPGLAGAVASLDALRPLFSDLADALARLADAADAEVARAELRLPDEAAAAAHRALMAHARPAEASVRRVDLSAAPGLVRAEALDRVRHELDLWGGGVGPGFRAAEAEVTEALADVVARWRARRG
jgi:hypothetical protein